MGANHNVCTGWRPQSVAGPTCTRSKALDLPVCQIPIIVQIQSVQAVLKVTKPHHQLSDKVLLSDSTIGLPQTRRDKRQNGRQRGRRGHNKDQRRQLSEKLLKGTMLHNFFSPGWPWETFGSTWYKVVLNSSSLRGLADAGDHRVGFEGIKHFTDLGPGRWIKISYQCKQYLNFKL